MIAVALCGLALQVAVPSHSYAQPAKAKQSAASLIKKGQDSFDKQKYEESIQTLSAALMRPGIAKTEKIEVYRLLAYNYIVLRRTEEADAAVRGLLVLDESFELPDTESPRFRDFFDKTRKQWEEEGKPGKIKAGTGTGPTASNITIKHKSPDQVDAGEPVKLTGKIADPDAVVAKVKVYYRASGAKKFKSVAAKYGMYKFSAQIPADVVEPPLVEYYIEARDEAGLPVAGRGDAASPLRIVVPESGSIFSSPWFWVPVGVVSVAAVITIAVVATGGDGGENGNGPIPANTANVSIIIFD